MSKKRQTRFMGAGELEGAAARLEWNRMPRGAYYRKRRGERSKDLPGDLSPGKERHFQAFEEVLSDLFESLKD